MPDKNSKDSLWDLMLKYAKLQQQEYYELLPECTVYEQHEYKYLYQNIGFALFGSPSDITGENMTVDDQRSSDDILNQFRYKLEFREVIDKIYEKVRDIGEGKVRNKCIYFGIIFNITFCAKSNFIKAKNENKQDNGKNNSEESKMGCGSSPIFKVKRRIINNILKAAKSTSDSYEEWYIDACARVYKSWKDYKSENVLPACTMVIPKNGFYQPDPTCEITEECSTVWLEVLESPQCSKTAAILKFSDKTAMAVGVASMGLSLLALATPAAPIVVGATATGAVSGVWSTGRSIYNLINRSSHEQSISVTDRDALCSWVSIAGSVLATASMGGNALLQNAIKKGSNINIFMKHAYNTILISNLGVNGCGVALNAYCMYDKYQKGDSITVYDWLSVGTNILFFSSAVVNFQLAGDLIESTQGKILDDYRTSLRSKRLRKEFNRANRNAAGNNSDRAAQNAEVIRYINKKAELNLNLQKNTTNNSQRTTKNKPQSNLENNSQSNSQSTTKNKSPSNLENNSQTTSKTDSQSNIENNSQSNSQSTIKNESQNNLKNNSQTTSKTDSQSNVENKTQNNPQSTMKNKSQNNFKNNLQTTSKTDPQSNIENNSQSNSQSTIKNKSQNNLKNNSQTTSKTDSQSNVENKTQNNRQSTMKNKSQNNLKNNSQTTSKTDSQSNVENKTQNNPQSTMKNKSQNNLKNNLQTTSKTDPQSNVENNSQSNSQSTTKNKSPSNLENNSQTTSKTDSQSNVENKTQNNPQSTMKNKSQNNLKNNSQTTSKTDSQSNVENKTQNNPQSTMKNKSQNNLKNNLQTTSKTDPQSNIENNSQSNSQSTIKNKSQNNLKNNSQTTSKTGPQSNIENNLQNKSQSTTKNTSPSNLKNNSQTAPKTDSQSNVENKTQNNPQSTTKNKSQSNSNNNLQSNLKNNSENNSCSSSVAPKIVVSFTNQKIMINGIPILDPIKFVMELLHSRKSFTESSAATTQEDEKNGPWMDVYEKMKQILKTLLTHVLTEVLSAYADKIRNVPDISKFKEILEDMKYMENAADILPLVFKISVLLVNYGDCVEYIHKAVYFVWLYVKESVIQLHDAMHSFITNPKIQRKISSVIIALSENMDHTRQILLPAVRLYMNTNVLYV